MLLGEKLALDLWPRFVKCCQTILGVIVYLGNVESKRRAKYRTDLAGPQREDDGIEFRDHLSAGKPSEVAPISGTIREFIGDSFEIGAGLDPFFDYLNGGQRLLLCGLFVDVFDDVRGANGLRDRHGFAMLAVVIDNVFVSRWSNAAGMTQGQSLDAETKFGLGGVSSCLLDDAGRHGLRIGQRCLTQQNPLNHVFTRPFFGSGFNRGRMFLRHGFRKAQAEIANFVANDFVLDQFVVDSEWQIAIVLNHAALFIETAWQMKSLAHECENYGADRSC